MESQKSDVPTDVTAASTQQKRNITVVASDHHAKRLPTRSNLKTATDFLLEENRIGSVVHIPNKKRRYVTLRSEHILNNLVTLYQSLFKQRWSMFNRSVDKFTIGGTEAKDMYQLLAITYISHWTQDVYRLIRDSVSQVDALAFCEKYHHQRPMHSPVYDTFLATLANHLKPTHITMTYADEIYIPLLAETVDTTSNNVAIWSKFRLDQDLFHIILQIFEEKKIVSMTPLSTDLFGRPSWLFDWSDERTAFAWFPQEANYNDEDVTIAYIIGVACTPKLAHCDVDEWKYCTEHPEFTKQRVDAYARTNRRRWKSSAEFKVVQSESIPFPNIYEKDKDKFNQLNTGPLTIVDDPTKPLPKKTTGSTSTVTADDAEAVATEEEDYDHVPSSPRPITRAQKSTSHKIYRTRLIDYMYYRQVILNSDDTTRFAAFRMLLKYAN